MQMAAAASPYQTYPPPYYYSPPAEHPRRSRKEQAEDKKLEQEQTKKLEEQSQVLNKISGMLTQIVSHPLFQGTQELMGELQKSKESQKRENKLNAVKDLLAFIRGGQPGEKQGNVLQPKAPNRPQFESTPQTMPQGPPSPYYYPQQEQNPQLIGTQGSPEQYAQGSLQQPQQMMTSGAPNPPPPPPYTEQNPTPQVMAPQMMPQPQGPPGVTSQKQQQQNTAMTSRPKSGQRSQSSPPSSRQSEGEVEQEQED